MGEGLLYEERGWAKKGKCQKKSVVDCAPPPCTPTVVTSRVLQLSEVVHLVGGVRRPDVVVEARVDRRVRAVCHLHKVTVAFFGIKSIAD